MVVTGAGGFIGSHLCERLAGLGARVRAVVHGNSRGTVGYLAELSPGHAAAVGVRHGDICDGGFIRTAISGADTVFHLAAVTSVAYSYGNPEETIATNVTGTANVCSAAREAGVRRLVHTSSAGVYGTMRDDAPITEEHPVQACNPYTAGKLGGDHVAESYYLSYDLPVATCRIFNTIGPRMGRFLVLPTIILQLLKGNVLRLGDTRPTRNFTYVDDIVTAFVRMAEEDAAVGQVVHFGSERDISIGDLARLTAQLMDRQTDIQFDKGRLRPEKSEIHRVVADSSKARRLLGWQPEVPLEEGIRRTVEWISAGGYDGALGNREACSAP